jgi:DNA mismatch repair protein MutH
MAASEPKNVPVWHDKFYHPLPYDPSNEQSILAFAGVLVRQRLGDKLQFWPLGPTNGKGKFGAVLEEFYFYKKPDATSEADFPAGIELKTAPLRLLAASGFSVKERVSLSMINYLDLPKETFETSTFLKKNARILLMFYLYNKTQLPTDALIQNVYYWRIPAEDLPVIREDWVLIHSKVAANMATELSEGHTRYLGACTKGAGRGQLRKQSDATTAKPRAFSLKRSYVQHIYDKYVLKETVAVPLIKKVDPNKTFETAVREAFERFTGYTGSEIASRLGLRTNPSAKNFNAIITKKLFKIPADAEIEEFKKADIVTKTIRVKRNGIPKEHISFPFFRPSELLGEKWEESALRAQFSKRFFFVIYVEDESGVYRLRATRFWAMPSQDIERDVRKVWHETRKQLNSAVKATMPGVSFNSIAHVRPHGRDGTDRVQTPAGWYLTKSCFWLDARYISKQLDLPRLVPARNRL